ncbi:MAG: TlpA family protein disulfide reductase [Syntrophaceae bacterium]|nr:TlpA family protein disulfide reductase [Syntrophaceae bacterium]
MKKVSTFLITLIEVIGLSQCFLHPAISANKPPAKGDLFPAIKLPVPKDLNEKRYLGISDGGSFSILHIKARVLIIEIYSLYCPHCQAFAPEVNALYRMIEQIPGLQDQIKLIGIGAGNSPLEVKAFKEKYGVPFPLFPDEDFAIHKMLGEVRTPYFITIKINKDRTHQIIYSESGGFGEAETFLQTILKASGLK